MNIENLLKQKQNVLYDILPNATLGMCVEILNERRIGALLVRDSQGNLEGIITERDIMRTMSAHHGQVWDIQVNEVMTPWGRIISAAPDEPIQAIMERMTSNRIRHIPVMDGGKIIGLNMARSSAIFPSPLEITSIIASLRTTWQLRPIL